MWAGSEKPEARKPRASWLGYRFHNAVSVSAVKISQTADRYPGLQSSDALALEYENEDGEWCEYAQFIVPRPVSFATVSKDAKVPQCIQVSGAGSTEANGTFVRIS